MNIIALTALSDNYIFMIESMDGKSVAVVDPGDAQTVLNALKGRSLEAILVTHHHHDHTLGIPELVKEFPKVQVIGSTAEGRIKNQNIFVSEGDLVNICGYEAQVLDVHAHTRGHIAFYFPLTHNLFSGDTIFSGTCGAIFEGSIKDMFAALQKIRALPPQTKIWCAHEYTLQYLADAAKIEPYNALILQRLHAMKILMAKQLSTLPLILSEEIETNPFLHWDAPELCTMLATHPGFSTFERLSQMPV